MVPSPTLSMELRNDGAGRRLIPFSYPELNIRYNLIFLKDAARKAAAMGFLAGRDAGMA